MEVASLGLVESISRTSTQVITVASVITLAIVGLAVLIKNPREMVKKILFSLITVVVLITTVYLVGATLYLNLVSATGGPVHWHADFEIWDCGREIELADPHGFSNKVGTAVLHEHNDQRIHVEGVLVDLDDASLGHFFNVTGGQLDASSWDILTPDGINTRRNGDLCNDQPGTLQVFVYQTNLNNKTFSQHKLTDPAEYILNPHSNIPPGDCIIIEFNSEEKTRTDKLCESYEVQVLKENLTEAI